MTKETPKEESESEVEDEPAPRRSTRNTKVFHKLMFYYKEFEGSGSGERSGDTLIDLLKCFSLL